MKPINAIRLALNPSQVSLRYHAKKASYRSKGPPHFCFKSRILNMYVDADVFKQKLSRTCKQALKTNHV